MARFQPRIDIWTLTPDQRAALQPGQHITAGPNNPGVWMGQKKNGTDVAAWEGNMRGRNRRDYLAFMRRYALA